MLKELNTAQGKHEDESLCLAILNLNGWKDTQAHNFTHIL